MACRDAGRQGELAGSETHCLRLRGGVLVAAGGLYIAGVRIGSGRIC